MIFDLPKSHPVSGMDRCMVKEFKKSWIKILPGFTGPMKK